MGDPQNRIIVYGSLCRVPYFGNLKKTELGFRAWGLGFGARNLQRLEVGTFKVCNPRFWVPNTQIKNHIPWLKDPSPKEGTKPKGTKTAPRIKSTLREVMPLTAIDEICARLKISLHDL